MTSTESLKGTSLGAFCYPKGPNRRREKRGAERGTVPHWHKSRVLHTTYLEKARTIENGQICANTKKKGRGGATGRRQALASSPPPPFLCAVLDVSVSGLRREGLRGRSGQSVAPSMQGNSLLANTCHASPRRGRFHRLMVANEEREALGEPPIAGNRGSNTKPAPFP